MKLYGGKKAFLGLLIAGVAMTMNSSAVAQTPGTAQPDPGGVDVQTFRPVSGPGGILTIEGTETADHLQPYGSIFVDYFSNPLMLDFADGSREAVVDSRMGAHVLLGVGVMDQFQFELGMPVVFMNTGEYLGDPIQGGGPGDLNARMKGTIFSSLDEVVGLGAMIDLTLPTGQTDAYLGSTTVTATPALIADSRLETPMGDVLLATNLGMRIRSSSTVHNVDVGPEVTYGLGAEVEAVPDLLRVGLETVGAIGIGGGRATNPLEMLLSAKFDVVDGFSVTAGAGGGLISGIGSPQWRGLVGLTYRPTVVRQAPAVAEDVEDEIVEHETDDCPDEPAGFAGPYDDDGCAITPENFTGCDDLDDDWKGAIDKWGCPLLDSDGDGTAVWDDDCPFEPVVFIGIGGEDGCPNYDVDGDGFQNTEDHCPLKAGVAAHNGCPPPKDEERAIRVDDEIEIGERVHFESDKAIIKAESYDLLEEVALVITQNPDILLVEVAGHTDERGGQDYNMMLSEERAKAVREFLIKRGNVRAARVDARGYGMSEPIYDEDTDEAHAENRRVEFRIMETGDQ